MLHGILQLLYGEVALDKLAAIYREVCCKEQRFEGVVHNAEVVQASTLLEQTLTVGGYLAHKVGRALCLLPHLEILVPIATLDKCLVVLLEIFGRALFVVHEWAYYWQFASACSLINLYGRVVLLQSLNKSHHREDAAMRGARAAIYAALSAEYLRKVVVGTIADKSQLLVAQRCEFAITAFLSIQNLNQLVVNTLAFGCQDAEAVGLVEDAHNPLEIVGVLLIS